MRAAKSIGIVHHICQVFEEETTHHKETKKYSIPASSQDFQKVIKGWGWSIFVCWHVKNFFLLHCVP